MAEKAAAPSTTPTIGHITRTMNNVGRLLVGADSSMPSLAMVLSGDTCYPISLSNFEAYLLHKEYSVELLQFVVWFQDYRRRFFRLPSATQAASPGQSHFAFAIPTPARTAERARASIARADAIHYVDGASLTYGSIASKATMSSPEARVQHLASGHMALAQADYVSSMYSHSLTGTPYGTVPSALESPSASKAYLHMSQTTITSGYVPLACDQPFQSECMRIIATFLKPGAAKELPLDPDVRETAVRDLAWNTHPDAFLPIYEEIYYTLETISLPRFLAAASANINRPKQLLWCTLGILGTAVGFLLAILLITVVPIPPAANRAWRLFSVVPAAVGLSFIYSAHRGFCSQVWGRTATQLHEWELEEMDDETGTQCGAPLAPAPPTPSPPPSSTAASSRASYLQDENAVVKWDALAVPDSNQSDHGNTTVSVNIALFNAENSQDLQRAFDDDRTAKDITDRDSYRAHSTPSLSLFTRCVRASALPLDVDTEKARVTAYGGRRSPYFGPEKVVLDPRIRALHNAVMRDLVCFFILVTLAFSALVFSVPDGRN